MHTEDALASGEVPFTLNPGCLRLLNTYLGDRMHSTRRAMQEILQERVLEFKIQVQERGWGEGNTGGRDSEEVPC